MDCLKTKIKERELRGLLEALSNQAKNVSYFVAFSNDERYGKISKVLDNPQASIHPLDFFLFCVIMKAKGGKVNV